MQSLALRLQQMHSSLLSACACHGLQPAEKEFKPDRVPVYCTCEMPYNPDQLMIMCKVCEEW